MSSKDVVPQCPQTVSCTYKNKNYVLFKESPCKNNFLLIIRLETKMCQCFINAIQEKTIQFIEIYSYFLFQRTTPSEIPEFRVTCYDTPDNNCTTLSVVQLPNGTSDEQMGI